MAFPTAIAALGAKAATGGSVFDLLSGPSILGGLPGLSSSSGPAISSATAVQDVLQTTGDFAPNFGGSPGQLAAASIVPLVIVGGVVLVAAALLKGGK